MRGIINTLHELTERGVTVRSLHDGVHTSTSPGRMIAGILMSIAEYERELVGE
jgi:DNA invertase Pin-like site-specific DNA recombinase